MNGQDNVIVCENMDENGLPLRTRRLIMRRILPEDQTALYEIYGDEENARFQFFPAWTMDQVSYFIETQATVMLGDPGLPFSLIAVDVESSRVVGDVCLTIM